MSTNMHVDDLIIESAMLETTLLCSCVISYEMLILCKFSVCRLYAFDNRDLGTVMVNFETISVV